MWQDHPWTGVGPAHFDYRFRAYRPESSYVQGRPDRVHNDYLNTLVDWGVIGALLVASAWALFWWGVVRSWKYVQRAQNDLLTKRSNRSAFVLGGSLGLLAILVHSFVDFNMHVPANAILAVTLLALVAGHFRFATEQYWHTVRWPLRIPVLLILATTLVVLAYATWHRTHELRWLVAAENLRPASTAQTAAYEKAFALRPTNFEAAYNIAENYRAPGVAGPRRPREPHHQRHAMVPTSDAPQPLRSLPTHAIRHVPSLARKPRPGLAVVSARLETRPQQLLYPRPHGMALRPTADWPKVLEWMNESLKMKSDAGNVVAWSYIFIADAANRRGPNPIRPDSAILGSMERIAGLSLGPAGHRGTSCFLLSLLTHSFLQAALKKIK